MKTFVEQQTEIPKAIFQLSSRSVTARVWSLKGTIGLVQSYALRRRFSIIAEDELAADLVSAINAEIVNVAIDVLLQNAQGLAQFDRTPPSGVSYFEHKQTFKDVLAHAESNLLDNAGRGTINTMVLGRRVAELVGTLPGFVRLSDGSTVGAHIFGTLDGVVCVRAPHDGILDANTALCLYKGQTPFEAPVVYAPYMPLVVTTALPNGINPLLNQKAAAVWAAVDTLIPTFVTQLNIVQSGASPV